MRLLKDAIRAIAITILVVWLFNTFSVMRFFDELIYSYRFSSTGLVSKDILLVEISSETLKLLGNLPFDRKYHAEVLEKLAKNQNVIGIALWFDKSVSEPGDSQLAEVASKYKNVVFTRPVRWDNAQILYPQLAGANPTTAADDFIVAENSTFVGVTVIRTHSNDPSSKGWLETIPVKLFRLYKEGYKSPGQPQTTDTSPFDFIRQYNLQFAIGHPLSLEPLNNLGLTINYVGDEEVFQRLPFERFLGSEDFSWIKGKIVVIGLNIPSEGFFTPLSSSNGKLTSSLVITANALNTLVTGQYIRTLPPLFTSAALVIYCMILLVASRRVQNFKILVRLTIALPIFLFILNHLLFIGLRFQIVIFPFLMIAMLVFGYRAVDKYSLSH